MEETSDLSIKEPQSKKHKILKRVLIGFVALIVVLAVAFGVYLSRYNTGNETAKSLLQTPASGVVVQEQDDTIAFVPSGEIKGGIVFYPGAKIQADAYTPLANCIWQDQNRHFGMSIFDTLAA